MTCTGNCAHTTSLSYLKVAECVLWVSRRGVVGKKTRHFTVSVHLDNLMLLTLFCGKTLQKHHAGTPDSAPHNVITRVVTPKVVTPKVVTPKSS
jgi:hypothetical protein